MEIRPGQVPPAGRAPSAGVQVADATAGGHQAPDPPDPARPVRNLDGCSGAAAFLPKDLADSVNMTEEKQKARPGADTNRRRPCARNSSSPS